MTEPTTKPDACSEVDPFVDGELTAAAATRFRKHLVDCTDCRRRLYEALELGALYRATEQPPEMAP